MNISSERLAYWFLRLNGFLTTYNFIVHPDEETNGHYHQQTDVDVMGVRFPNRRENQVRPMADHPCFEGVSRIQFVLAETKSARCGLNTSWRDGKRQTMQKALRAAGIVPLDQVEEVAHSLYAHGEWTDARAGIWVRWLMFGLQTNGRFQLEFPRVPQLTWDREVLPFIFKRFHDYRLEKRDHGQWDEDAKGLFTAATRANGSCQRFIDQIRIDADGKTL